LALPEPFLAGAGFRRELMAIGRDEQLDFYQIGMRFAREKKGASGTGLLVILRRDRIEIFRVKDLPAVQAADVIDTVAAGNHLGPRVLARGLHNGITPF
jgi:hypothetical protein